MLGLWTHGLIRAGLADDARIAVWTSIPVLVLLIWSLATFAIFPAHITGRHYLSISPLVGFFFITVRTGYFGY